jgi:hypothetical protein
VLILPPRPHALNARDYRTVHDLLMDLAERYPGEQDMFVVFEDGTRDAFARPIDGSDELYADARTALDPFGVRVFRR